MGRISLWQDGRHSNDFKFMDRRMSEMFTLGGTGILLHKYLGTNPQGTQLTTSAAQAAAGTVLTLSSTATIDLGNTVTGTNIPANTTVAAKTATTITLSASTLGAVPSGTAIGISSSSAQPSYTNQSELNIQDLLWVENRDRKYDTSVYTMRGIYQRQDQDFDLTQFGLFLQTGTIFMTFHLRDMVDMIGRKIMAGDVLELQHLTDYDSLNQDVPAALKRFYVVGDASFSSEGFSPTWWPHLWRVKINPLVDSQEYKDIINNLVASDGVTPIGQIMSAYNGTIAINDAVVAEAVQNVPRSGYDTSSFYNFPRNQDGTLFNVDVSSGDQTHETADGAGRISTADEVPISPLSALPGYVVGDSVAPNGLAMSAGTSFPTHPQVGDFFLRTDYLPNRVFRFVGNRWSMFNDVVRTNLSQGADNHTLIGTFVNNTDTFTTVGNVTVPSKQSLSSALTPKADNS